MELFKLFGTIAINNQEANQDIDETTGKAKDSQSKITSAFKKIGTAVATYFAVEKIVNFGKACLDAAADAQAMESQFTQVFGDLEGDAANSLSKIAEEAGIAENRMKGSFTQIAAFAKTTGMETEESLALTERAMVAVADSAAFYDRTLEETTASLQSFLKGNYENDAALGLSCTETTRNAAANELYGKSFKDLSEAQKQLTLLQMVEDANKLSGAMGQASRESDTWTNQTGNLKQAWTDFTAAIGTHFLPVAIQVVKWLSTNIPKAQQVVETCMEKIGVVIDALAPIAKEMFYEIKDLWDTVLHPCLEAIGVFIEEVLAPVFKTVFIGLIVPAVQMAFKQIKGLWETVLQPVFTGITNFLSGIFTLNFKKAFQGIVSVVKGVFGGIVSVVKAPINSVINLVNSFIRGLNRIKVPSWVPNLGGRGISIPLIPRLEQGGILEKGQVGLLEGNGAEAVVPLDRNKAWISAVAKDMESAIGGNNEVKQLKEQFEAFTERLPEMLVDAFSSMKFDVNNREFARLVKAVG